MNEILVALIMGGCSIVAVILTNKSANDKMIQQQNTAQAVTDIKLDELTREVREHNNFAQKIPNLETKTEDLERRVGVLEKFHQKA